MFIILNWGCGTSFTKSQVNHQTPQLDASFTDTIQTDDINSSIVLVIPESLENDFEFDSFVNLAVQNRSRSYIRFPNDFGMVIFQYKSSENKWEEIKDRSINLSTEDIILSPKGKGPLWQFGVSMVPDVQYSNTPVKVRIFVFGNKVIENGEIGPVAAAYLDVILKP
jgi:hypothetical protein